jgi:hypothetical protein
LAPAKYLRKTSISSGSTGKSANDFERRSP